MGHPLGDGVGQPTHPTTPFPCPPRCQGAAQPLIAPSAPPDPHIQGGATASYPTPKGVALGGSHPEVPNGTPGTRHPAPMAMSRRLALVGGGTGGGTLGAHPNGAGVLVLGCSREVFGAGGCGGCWWHLGCAGPEVRVRGGSWCWWLSGGVGGCWWVPVGVRGCSARRVPMPGGPSGSQCCGVAAGAMGCRWVPVGAGGCRWGAGGCRWVPTSSFVSPSGRVLGWPHP